MKILRWLLAPLEVFAWVVSALLIAAALTTSGCSTVSAGLEDTTFYRRDIAFKVNGQKAVGAIVVPRASSYKIEGEVEGSFDFLIVRSCHREYTAEREGGHFSYLFEPREGIESNRACPLEIRGAEKGKGRHSFGFIDFENDRDLLPAKLECNGEVRDAGGVSVCQAPHGLIQRITFPVDVIFEPGSVGCDLIERKPGETDPAPRKVYEFKMPVRQCLFVFMETGAAHRTHRMMSLGYEATVVRGF
jgi:hypothetical protein